MSFASDLSTVANFISKMNSFNAVVESDRATESKAARGSWMVALATMLGKMADRLGDAIVDQAQLIDNEMNRQAGLREDGKEIKDSNLTQLNAEMTAMRGVSSSRTAVFPGMVAAQPATTAARANVPRRRVQRENSGSFVAGRDCMGLASSKKSAVRRPTRKTNRPPLCRGGLRTD